MTGWASTPPPRWTCTACTTTGRKATTATTNPDIALHEAGKYAALALGCNPTVTELMWLDADLIETDAELGGYLRTVIRGAFLSAGRARDAYFGYATQQFHRLQQRGDGTSPPTPAVAKHARHLLRLLIQGLALYRTGILPIRLTDEQVDAIRRFGDAIAGGDVEAAKATLASHEIAFDAAHTPLPDRPDEERVERWLRAVRHVHYTWPGQ